MLVTFVGQTCMNCGQTVCICKFELQLTNNQLVSDMHQISQTFSGIIVSHNSRYCYKQIS